MAGACVVGRAAEPPEGEPQPLWAGGRLLLASALAVLLASVVISTAVIYTQALAQAGLRQTLSATPPDLKNAQVAVLQRLLDPSSYQGLRQRVERGIAERLGWLESGTERFGQSLPIPVVEGSSEVATPQTILKASPFFFTGFQEHASLVAGRWRGWRTGWWSLRTARSGGEGGTTPKPSYTPVV